MRVQIPINYFLRVVLEFMLDIEVCEESWSLLKLCSQPPQSVRRKDSGLAKTCHHGPHQLNCYFRRQISARCLIIKRGMVRPNICKPLYHLKLCSEKNKSYRLHPKLLRPGYLLHSGHFFLVFYRSPAISTLEREAPVNHLEILRQVHT